jgi:myosin-5
VQSKSASVKDDLMNRLSNAIKQRDAAREEALLAAEKLNKLQEDLDNGVLQGPQQPLGSASPSQSLSTPAPFPQLDGFCMHTT